MIVELKRASALRAIEEVEDGMVVGLGTGRFCGPRAGGPCRGRAPCARHPDFRAHPGASAKVGDLDFC
jgi:hypothetical protein